MAFEKKFYGNSGALFTVKDKRNDKAPDLTGSLDLGSDTIKYIIDQQKSGNTEITLELSAWKKVSRGGSKFLSVQVREPYKKKDAGAGPTRASSSFDDDDEDKIPF